MDISVDAIQSVTDILECMSILHIQQTTAKDEHLQHLKKYYNYWLAEHKESASRQYKTILVL